MKKLFSLLSIVYCLLSTALFSQNQNLNSAESYLGDYENFKGGMPSLTSAKEKIDLASTNESTSGKYKTWFYKGKIYLALFNEALKVETTKSSETESSKKLLAAYNVIPTTDLEESLKSFQKELELDEKKIYAKEASGNIKVIASTYSDKAYACLINKNYADALTNYQKAYDMELKMNITDTAAVNNMAISAVKMKDYKKAEQQYNKLIELKYKPERCYLSLIQMYTEVGDTASVRSMVNKAVAAMPDSYTLLIEQINLLLKDGKSESAISSINLALAKSPNNHELHLVLGQTYNKMAFPKDAANKDLKRPANSAELAKKAEDEFSKAIQIKQDYFYGQYSLGALYVFMGTDILKQSENIKDPKKVKTEEDKADELFQKAIPLLEKAHELDPGDKDTMKTLRQLYARTGQGGSEKYKKLDAELKGAK